MQDVAVDACCLINLLAAGPILSPTGSRSPRRKKKAASAEPVETPHGLGLILHVPTKVTQETFYLLQPGEREKDKLVKTPVDLAPFIESGVIHPCDLESGQETELFVQLAIKLDDGEAACFAIAQSRGWLLATDDRPATKLAAQSGVSVITTPEMVKRWAKTTGAADANIATVLQNIQIFARFVPRRNSPEYRWWISKTSRS
jgi:predicted nucleic acid-binding protein